MARRRYKKKRASRKRKIPIMATIGLIAGVSELVKAYKDGGWFRVQVAMTGFDPNWGWNWKWAKAGIPMFAGVAGSMVASKVGLNRHLAGIPFIKL